MSDVYSRLKTVVANSLSVDEEQITREASFTDDLGADSLDLIEIRWAIEDEFDLALADDKVKEITTVGEVLEILEKRAANE